MRFSKQLFPLFFLLIFLFLFPLRHASNPKECSSSYSKPLRCGPLEVPIRFPFCDHPRFSLHCNDLNKTVLELPMSGTFLVQDIDYKNQQIYINHPENCLAKRLLTFNISGSPFSYPYVTIYTLFACPKEVVLPTWDRSIPCLSNSTSNFFATSNSVLAQSMLFSCQIVKRIHFPDIAPFGERGGFSTYLNNQTLSLEWNSPNCKDCEVDNLRCGFNNQTSLEVKCLDAKRTEGYLSMKSIVIIICVSVLGGVIFYNVCMGCIRCTANSEDPDYPRPETAAIETATVAQGMRGLDQSTIESYKTVELGESRSLPGTNGIVCPICLSEYKSKETVRFIPECDHCFHVECIDVWLKIHGSCPLCRKTHHA